MKGPSPKAALGIADHRGLSLLRLSQRRLVACGDDRRPREFLAARPQRRARDHDVSAARDSLARDSRSGRSQSAVRTAVAIDRDRHDGEQPGAAPRGRACARLRAHARGVRGDVLDVARLARRGPRVRRDRRALAPRGGDGPFRPLGQHADLRLFACARRTAVRGGAPRDARGAVRPGILSGDTHPAVRACRAAGVSGARAARRRNAPPLRRRA